jgi:hypothetical protein
MERWVLFLDGHPAIYWIPGFGAIAVLAIASSAPRVSRAGFFGFLLLTALTVIALRLPGVYHPLPLNPDESQMLAQAMRFTVDPVPWRGVDSTSSGPLNSYVLMLSYLFGSAPSYVSGRLVGLALLLGTIFATVATIAQWAGHWPARVVIVPLCALLAFESHHNFVHYTSEHLPILLLSGGVLLAIGRPSMWRGVACGLLFGLAPFAKLQATPIAIALLGVAIVGWLRKGPRRPAVALLVGAASIPTFTLGLLVATGALRDFWLSYVMFGAHFTRGMLSPWQLVHLAYVDRTFFAWLASSALLLAIGILHALLRRRSAVLRDRAAVLAWLVYMVVCLFVVMWPGRRYPHYLLLLVHPVTLGLGLVAGWTLVDRSEERGDVRTQHWACAAAGAAAALIVTALLLERVRPFVGSAARFQGEPDSEAARILSSLPARTLSVWGWMPEYYVLTGLVPATRDAITESMILPGPEKEYFRERYLSDLKAEMPDVFVDAVVEGGFAGSREFRDPQISGHRTFPKLAEFVGENYVRVRWEKPGEVARFEELPTTARGVGERYIAWSIRLARPEIYLRRDIAGMPGRAGHGVGAAPRAGPP